MSRLLLLASWVVTVLFREGFPLCIACCSCCCAWRFGLGLVTVMALRDGFCSVELVVVLLVVVVIVRGDEFGWGWSLGCLVDRGLSVV